MSNAHTSPIRKKIIGYCIGFVLSLLSTGIAYWLVIIHISTDHMVLEHGLLTVLLMVLAVSQFILQLVYFLHIGSDDKPQWRVLVLWFMIIMVLIIGVGSLWIMDNLNYNMMHDPQQVQQYIDKSNSGGF